MSTQESEPPKPATTAERKTMELCGNEHGGHRCMLSTGHRGHHECHTVDQFFSWK